MKIVHSNLIILCMVDGSLNTFVFKGHGLNDQQFMERLACPKNKFTCQSQLISINRLWGASSERRGIVISESACAQNWKISCFITGIRLTEL